MSVPPRARRPTAFSMADSSPGGVDHDVEPLTVRIHENELLNAFGGWVDHEVGTELVSEGALRRDRAR